MNSPRKYRGLRVDNREEVKGYYFVSTSSLHPNPVHYIIVDVVHDRKSIHMEIAGEAFACYRVIPGTVGQSTGLKDKDGSDTKWEQEESVEIFENDNIRFVPCGRSGKMRHTGTVYYNEKAGGFWVKGKVWDCPIDMCTQREVIGNIHTTPQLMEQT